MTRFVVHITATDNSPPLIVFRDRADVIVPHSGVTVMVGSFEAKIYSSPVLTPTESVLCHVRCDMMVKDAAEAKIVFEDAKVHGWGKFPPEHTKEG